MPEPLVSILLPNYNHSLFLRQRIDSILEQTFQNFELIILDDCSLDNSKQIINKYAQHKNISYIDYADQNSGSTFKQWQKGFNLARGKYIWIAESDDYSDLSFLSKLVPLLEQSKNVIVAYAGSYLVDETGKILPFGWDVFKGGVQMEKFSGREFVLNKMLTKTSIYNAGMAVFRKSALLQMDDSYTQYKSCGDWLFWSKICMIGEVMQYNEKLNYFRQHSNKVTSRSEANGIRFTEGKYVVKKIANLLALTDCQWKVVIGAFMKDTKRFKKFASDKVKDEVLDDLRSFFGFKSWYLIAYRIDKILNITGLNIRKNK